MDGRLLALARQEKDAIRTRAIQTDRQRHETVYKRVPALRRLDEQIAAVAAQTVDAVMGHGRPIEQLKAESLELQAQRAELLAENGWPIDYLDGAWDCPRCRDMGYYHGEMCQCLRKLYDRVLAKDLSALLKLGNESFNTFDLNFYEDRPDPVSGVAPRVQMKTVFAICRDYALNFSTSGMNLLFRGSTGLGKTFLSACIAREVARQGFSVVYETAADALGAFETQKFSRDEQAVEQADALVRRLLGCDLLILDDLGTEMVTEFSKSALYTLVNTRLNTGKNTVISTNLSDAQLEKKYTPQIASRLEGEYQVLTFAGRDIRLIKKERGLD